MRTYIRNFGSFGYHSDSNGSLSEVPSPLKFGPSIMQTRCGASPRPETLSISGVNVPPAVGLKASKSARTKGTSSRQVFRYSGVVY